MSGDYSMFIVYKRNAEEHKKTAEDYEIKHDYVNARKYYFEAAKKYKEAAIFAKENGHAVFVGDTNFYKEEENMMLEFEYCMMQVRAINNIKYGIEF